MEKEILVKVEHVSKKFCKDLKTSLWYGVKDLFSEFFGLKKNKQLRNKEFYAVKDVSFELHRGDFLGLIGHNGAGKSTLLKMLNGLIKPDDGTITMYGRIGALIELGAGFNPILTGRENIYINGEVLGFSKKEIDEKFDAILEFAEIDEFIDTPVQNYSSGMKVRLGFAVAAQMEPDVLIIDEVLAVGDIGFRSKCFNRIHELQENCAVIFVSHAIHQISRLSTFLIHLNKGKIAYIGSEISIGIEQFYNKFGKEKYKILGNGDAINLYSLAVNENKDAKQNDIRIKQFDPVNLEFEFNPIDKFQKFGIIISIFDRELKGVLMVTAESNNLVYIASDGIVHVNLRFNNYLAPGNYSLNIHITQYINKNYKTICSYMHISSFTVFGNNLYTVVPVHLNGLWDGTVEKLELV